MKGRLTAALMMGKAMRACASARALIGLGDMDGACNRAYYAMFDAAKAALLSTGADTGKTHRGILNAFSDQLIKSERLPKEMGRALKHAETFRYVADYEGGSVDLPDAEDMVAQAEAFVAALNREFFSVG